MARVPVYDENGDAHSYFDFVPDGKGLCKRGKGTSGLFLPGKKPKPGETWLLVEGGKDAAALVGMGYLAAGLPGTAMHEKYANLFKGCHINIVPDLDEPAMDGAQKTGGRLVGIAADVKISRIPGQIKPSGGDDVRDVLRRAGGEGMIREAIESASAFKPAPLGSVNNQVVLTFDEAAVAEEVIRRMNSNTSTPIVFQRGGILVGITEAGTAESRIRKLPQSSIRGQISSNVELVERKGSGDFERLRPPHWLVKSIVEKGEYNKKWIPRLNGITSWPTLRPDGSLLQKPGYDSATGLFFAPQIEFPDVPDHPKQADAHTSLAQILEVVCDFPFVSEGDKSVFLALVITFSFAM